MNNLYALLVGIDTYRSPYVRDLQGCRTDIDEALAFLQTRTTADTKLNALVLRDGEATRAAVIEGLHSHLGQAGAGDTALFWFSGHGSQAPAPRWWYEESAGMLQTLVCADSRHGGVPDLLDKELSILLDSIARQQCHVAVVLDSCYSGGATRELEEREPAAQSRSVDPLPVFPAPELMLPELRVRDAEPAGPPAPDHVALAASRIDETAQEMDLGGRRRGLFSWALLRALSRLGPTASYRELLVAAQTEVRQNSYRQVPQLLPVTRGIADQPFLGGNMTPPVSGMVLRYAHEGWEINAGSCHGLPAVTDAAAGPIRVSVVADGSARAAEVVQMLPERSLVTPVDWRPERDEQYQVVLTGVPLPATTVAVGGPDQDRATADSVLAALRTAGPGGGPSPHLRPVDPNGTGTVPELRARVLRPGLLRLTDRHDDRLGDDISGVTGEGARTAVTALEHIARWRQVRDLDNPVSRLAGAVAVEIVAARPGEVIGSLTRAPLDADEDGVVRLHYERTPTGWIAPTVFIRLHNRSDRPLFCVLLDLTERCRIHAGLFPGGFVAAGHRGAALRGRRVEVSLPPGCVPEPGGSVKDWLKLIVAEKQFGPEPFEMPALGERWQLTRGPLAVRGLLDRLGRAAVYRDMAASLEDEAYDWASVTIPLVTQVPGRAG